MGEPTYVWGGTLRDSGWDTLAPAAGYIWGGALRDSGEDTFASAAGYIWGGALRDTLAPAAGYIWGNDLSFASVVLMCRLYLSRRRKEEEGADLSLKFNDPKMKGGGQDRPFDTFT